MMRDCMEKGHQWRFEGIILERGERNQTLYSCTVCGESQRESRSEEREAGSIQSCLLKKLPKWARELLEEARGQADQAERRMAALEGAHGVLFGRDWFTIPPSSTFVEDGMNLFILTKNEAVKIATLFEGDVLLVGCGKDRERYQPVGGGNALCDTQTGSENGNV